MSPSRIQPDQAWRMVVDQLHMEMSLASFNSWVRDTEFVAFEKSILTVGVFNAYARDWLTSRLTSTVNRMLAGMLDQPVEVHFVVFEEILNEENEPQVDDLSLGEKPVPDDTPDVITLQAEYLSIYDEIVQPEHVIVIPGYFLRYIPMLGLELSWLYIGFRQAAYEAGASKKPGKKVSAPAKKVAWYAGMSPRSFWRWTAKPNTWKLLGRLVKPVEAHPQWHHGNDGRPHQSTHSYRVAMSIPLTPFDESSLRSWLFRKLAEGKTPLVALHVALETPVDELLPWPEKMPSLDDMNGRPSSIHEVVREVCSPILESEQGQFNELTEQLAQHLMPSKDLIFLTHYFVSHWLPRLGPGPGWFVALMRDSCYLNQRTGEIRDEIRLDDGYAEAARWLGLKRVKTIWEWLRSPDLSTFIRETGREVGSWEEAPRYFKVCLGEPLLEGDQDRAALILSNRSIGASVTHRDPLSIDSIGAIGKAGQMNSEGPVGANVTHRNSVNTDLVGVIGVNSHTDDGNPIGASVIHRDPISIDSIGAIGKPGQMAAESPIGASVTHSERVDEASVGATGTHRKDATGSGNGASGSDMGVNDGHSPIIEVNLTGKSVTQNENGISTMDSHNETVGEGAIGASVIHRKGIESPKIGAIGTSIGASVTHIGAIDIHRIGASGTLDWRNCHSLNSLTPGLKHLKNTQTTALTESEKNSAEPNSLMEKPVGVVTEWKLKDLLALNRISPKNQERLLEKGVMAQAFISWLLYAASQGGNSIRDPIGHAVSRLMQDPSLGAGGAYDRLAGLPARELSELLQRELKCQSPWNTDWRTAMESAPRLRLRALADQLGVPVSEPNYW